MPSPYCSHSSDSQVTLHLALNC